MASSSSLRITLAPPLFDRLDGTESPLNNELVDVREADIRFLARISAVVGLAAPMENILYGRVSVEAGHWSVTNIAGLDLRFAIS